MLLMFFRANTTFSFFADKVCIALNNGDFPPPLKRNTRGRLCFSAGTSPWPCGAMAGEYGRVFSLSFLGVFTDYVL